MKIGEKIRIARLLKGYTQDYMATNLEISQRSYSKIERNEIKVDWGKINRISNILEIEPIDLINFSEKDIFINKPQSDITSCSFNKKSEMLFDLYENTISHLEDEIKFLRDIIIKDK